MSKRMIIDASHPEETRVVVLDTQKVEEFDFEAASKRPLKGNIYLAKVTRVEPSLQAAFVEYGGNRQGFLAFAEIHPDYYQIPVADRMALIAEQEVEARQQTDDDVESVDTASAAGPAAPVAESRPEDDADRSTTADDELDGVRHWDEIQPESVSPFSSESEAENGERRTEAVEQETRQAAQTDTVETDAAPSHEGPPGSSRLRSARAPQRWARRRHYKIQEVIKRRQIILVQVVKEERGNKGAAMTTYLSLAGRYCVLMPNTPRGGGISRKITSAADRDRLKSAAQSLELPEGMGLIIRTAGENRSKAEIKRDYEYLLRMWDTIRELTLRSNAPACVYEEGDLVKRAIRDLYNKDVSEILVEGEDGYRNAKDFMRMLMPSHAKNVRLYKEPVPLFQRYQVESQLDAMFMPTVTLRSGGYIVINQTEALVAIDVNSGKATREHSIEDTAYKTNLEAAEEIARQLRLRDLAGLIVIDFIDMEDARNDRNVEKRLRDCIKSDRARVQIGKISQFGLLEMSRQRLRAGVVAGSTIACSHCGGQGIVRSVESTALRLLRGLEEEAQRQRASSVCVRAPLDVAVYALNQKRREISRIETDYRIAIQFEPKESMMAGTFEIDRIGVRSSEERAPTALAQEHVAVPEEDQVAAVNEAASDHDVQSALPHAPEPQAPSPGSSRRRRRRGRGRDRENLPGASPGSASSSSRLGSDGAATAKHEIVPSDDADRGAGGEATDSHTSGQSTSGRKRRRRRRGRRGAGDNTNTTSSDPTLSAEETSPTGIVASNVLSEPIPDTTGSHLLSPEIQPNASSEPVWSLTPEIRVTAAEPAAEPPQPRSPTVDEPIEQAAPADSVSGAGPSPQTSSEPARKGWWQRPFRRNG
ncbi:MAG: Rne/Rng family ribonuclease [Rhizomicrobium sp.]